MDGSSEDPIGDFITINQELEKYDPFLSNKPQVVVLNKVDIPEVREKEAELVRADEVQQKWVQVITLARTKILGIPTKAKQRIPELDTTAITCLEDIVRETLEDLADRKAA